MTTDARKSPDKPIYQVTVSVVAWERLRALCYIPHEHCEGQNECAICDEELTDSAIRRIEELDRTLRAVLKAHEAEAKAALALVTAEDNFTDPEPDRRKAEKAMIAAADADTDARMLLAKYQPKARRRK